MNKELTVEEAAEIKYPIIPQEFFDESLMSYDEYIDTQLICRRAFLAGHSLANERIKELEGEKDKWFDKYVGADNKVEMQGDDMRQKDKRIAELSALLLQREGEAVEFKEWSDKNFAQYEDQPGFYHESLRISKPFTTQQLYALFIEHKNKKESI